MSAPSTADLQADLTAPEPAAETVGLESFYRAGRFLGSILDLDELLRAILEEGLAAVRGTRGFVGLINRSTGELELRIIAGHGWEDLPDKYRRPAPPGWSQPYLGSIPIVDEPGCGITVRIILKGVPFVSGDVRRHPDYVMFFPDVRSEIAVPLFNRDGRVIGVINIESEETDAFSQRDLQLLSALSNQAAIAISVANHRLRERALIDIGNDLASSTDTDELFGRVVKHAAELLRADDCSLFQLYADAGRLILKASGPILQGRVGELTYSVGEGLTGWVARHETPIRIADVREDDRWRGLYPELPRDTIESYLAVPVFTRKGLWGVLRVVRRKPANAIITNEFTARDEAVLTTLARQVGAAITQQNLINQQVQMERMAAWGEMSARSAHMIGNKVFALKGQLNELEYLAGRKALTNAEVLDVVERAKSAVFRLEEILTEFRDFLMATHIERRPVDLNELVSAAIAESFPKDGGIALRVEAGAELPPVSADASKMQRAISELLENAVLHQKRGGEICVVTGLWGPEERAQFPQMPFRGGDAVRIEVRDRGPGVPEENKKKLFEPFFTTRSKGMGLGLSIVKGIVDAHQGAILEVGKEGEGARFVIVLPAHREG
jgi:signal transduction histidine kinase